MKKELLEKIKKVEQAIIENKEIGINKLERLSDEARRAFTSAIESVASAKNLMKEIELRREKLKSWRIGVLKTIFPLNLKYIFSMPFIYGMFFPVVIFSICLEIYHQVCFRIYGIPLVDKKEFFIYDRQLLPYLNWLEKFNCLYCSYVNNVFRYAVEIGGRTERFWCPIKYARRVENIHSQYHKFAGYLDAENFRTRWQGLRDFSDIKEKVENKSNDKIKTCR
ncbi:hypothetical protein HY797_02420 [Candidatus Falkowbacteria bacterium]|nr:hypothetical protein [Candidatus Falkowbacteria bacterium]